MVGGAEKVVESLCLGLPDHGFDVGVACFREAGPLGQALALAGVPIRTNLAPRRTDPFQIQAIRSHLRHCSADIVHVLDHSNVLLYGRLAARSLGLPQVCAVHRTRRADGSPSLGRVDRGLMSLSDKVIAVSEGHARYLVEQEGLSGSRVTCIHNGVDPAVFAAPLEGEAKRTRRRDIGLPEAPPMVAVVAALRPEKNHELLFDALADAALHGLHVAVVGDGVQRESLEHRVAANGLGDRVHWLGVRHDIPAILTAVDALVLPSHPNVETFPVCVLEAMAASLPVVATRVGSLDELVVPGKTGELVPPGDTPGLVRALVALVESPASAREAGVAGRTRLIQNFTREKMVVATAELLRELLPSRAL